MEKSSFDADWNVLEERRNFLDGVRVKSADSLDKYLLTFATGGLYLSVYFTSSLSVKLIYSFLLFLGWLFLIGTIVFTLCSLLMSIYAYSLEIRNVELKKTQLAKGKFSTLNNKWNKPIRVFRIMYLTLFILGTITLSTFYFLNISNMDKQPRHTSNEVIESTKQASEPSDMPQLRSELEQAKPTDASPKPSSDSSPQPKK